MTNQIFLNYKDAGVDIDASKALTNHIKDVAEMTRRPEVIGEIGSFSALCALPQKYQEPILVSSTDGVGTKLRLAIDLKHHNTIGVDLVAMCVNDLVVHGAEPLFFLDYYATGKLNVNTASAVIAGIAEGCLQSGCALVGGETAEMPSMYHKKDYEIAGFCVGIVEKSKIIDGSKVKDGDILIAIASSGLHSNGYSLVRKILQISQTDPLIKKLRGKTLIDHLMVPTCIYVKNILNLIKQVDIHAIIHITGGGFWENIPRILPKNTHAVIYETSWEWPVIFNWLQQVGNINRHEMYRTFNCGVGMIVVVSVNEADKVIKLMKTNDKQAWKIGVINAIGNEERVIFIK